MSLNASDLNVGDASNSTATVEEVAGGIVKLKIETTNPGWRRGGFGGSRSQGGLGERLETMISVARILLVAALLSGQAAGAEELEQRLSGTWVLEGVEEKDASGNWVVREAPNIGMLIYSITGPMSGGVLDPAAVAGPATVSGTGNTPSVPSERAVMTIGDGDVRLIWTLSRPVR